MASERELIDLLASRHVKDVFVPQCKNGPTWFANHLRLDAWAMRRSWAHPETYGYEIKVGRSDWLADNKWRAYLPYCTTFYFVAPSKKIITPEEVPGDAGLLVASTNATRLYTLKKAPQREIQVPRELYEYILMSRVRIVGREYRAEEEAHDAQWWAEWLRERHEWRDLGYAISIKIGELVRKAKEEIESTRRQMVEYEHLRERIKELGFDERRPASTWSAVRIVDQLTRQGMPQGLISSTVGYLAEQMAELARQLKVLENRR